MGNAIPAKESCSIQSSNGNKAFTGGKGTAIQNDGKAMVMHHCHQRQDTRMVRPIGSQQGHRLSLGARNG